MHALKLMSTSTSPCWIEIVVVLVAHSCVRSTNEWLAAHGSVTEPPEQ